VQISSVARRFKNPYHIGNILFTSPSSTSK
jgi:hypothetical protein